ncbi:hypothetical protein [Rhizobium leguminosarum]|uniref:hypothetical protein n=1 Tax=Rhizobium leguminosarum TaxID=384 RepID=UPI0010316345|nr:hypothetical protein [Rhizobium leguminosarum]TAY88113.1 hypothetical protein ELH83_09935 [Rhizobium leguminosarum]
MSGSEQVGNRVNADPVRVKLLDTPRPWRNPAIEALFSKMLLNSAPNFVSRNFVAVAEEYEAAIPRAHRTPSCRDQQG